MLVNQPIFLVSPTTVVARLIALLGDGAFYAALGFSFLRIALGFLGGLLLGTLAGAAAGRYRWVEILHFPYMVTVRSIPVASFAVVALLWFSSGTISAFVSFLIVLPIVYHAVQEGTRRIDPQMREMAAVFRFSPFDLSKVTGKELLDLGLSVQDYCIVAFGVVAMFTVSMCGRNGSVREKISQKPYVIRYGLFVLLFFAVLLLGSYGVGFEAQQFIYNQF